MDLNELVSSSATFLVVLSIFFLLLAMYSRLEEPSFS